MKTKKEALAIINSSTVKMGQIWRHEETDAEYAVVALGIQEGTMTPTVAYADNDGTIWFRDLEVFLGDKNGKPRFVLAGDIAWSEDDRLNDLLQDVDENEVIQ